MAISGGESGIGPDIKEVYDELGSSITIINRDPVITGHKIIYETNSQATKPFIREHHIDCSFPYNNPLDTGDIIKIDNVDRYYMVMNKTPELFEDQIVEYSSILYLCNIPTTACIVRPIEIRNSSTYDMINGWEMVIESPVYGVLSDRVFGSTIEQGLIEGQNPVWRIDLYIPKWYDIKSLDRIIVSPTEYYKIEAIESYNYPGSVVALLVEDTRPETIISGGEIVDD